MAFSFLVTLREGVEMALIVAILLGYLRSVGQKRHFREIWMGVGVAAGICLAIGVSLEVASAEMDKRVVEAFEGFAMIFAVAVLTGMAFWMRRQAAGISVELRAQMSEALNRGSVTALVLLAATSVGREGLETTLFLFAGSANGSSGPEYWLGGALGFGVAAGIGLGIYHGTSRVPLKQFFLVSGVGVLVLAAGLLANSVVKLYEAAIITNLGARPWDTEGLISITSTMGKFLNTLLGYDSAPSMLQIGLYWGYLTLAVAAFLLIPVRKPAGAAAIAASHSSSA
ncbi:MAG: iron transporter [Anaerolinea sp.]|nr:iron transporter [Anaerolinea sp.]